MERLVIILGALLAFNSCAYQPNPGTSANTNSTTVKRDSGGNTYANSFDSRASTTVTAGSTGILNANVSPIQETTGTSTHTWRLPAGAGLNIGRTFRFRNRSTGNVTIQDSSAAVLYVMPGGTDADAILTVTGTPGTWNIPQRGQFAGTATNDSANTGNIGETFSVTGTSTVLTSATVLNFGNFTLTSGDYDCSFAAAYTAAAGTSITEYRVGLATAAATLPASLQAAQPSGGAATVVWLEPATVPGNGTVTFSSAPYRVSVSGTLQLFLNVRATFTVSSMVAQAYAQCRRMR